MASEMKDDEFMMKFSLMIGALILLTVVIFVIANNIGGKHTKMAKADKAENKALVARIEPVGKLVMAGTISNAQAAAPDGAGTYNTACIGCHGSGAAGAPKMGDKAAWKPRIAKGKDALYKSALHGIPGTAMLAKGGNAALSDAAVKAAVDHMVNNSK